MRVRNVVLLSLFAIVIMPTGALAGGWWSFLQVPGRYFGVGETITFMENEVMFDTIEEADGARSEDFGVYLVENYDEGLLDHAMTRPEPDDWWEPLSTPMRIGDLELVNPDSNLMKARVTFTVPEVPPGRYALVLCSNPDCDQSLGNVIPSEVIVTQDVLAAQTARRVANESFENEMALVRLRHRLGGVRSQLSELRAEMAEMEPATVTAPISHTSSREPGLPWLAYAGWFLAGGVVTASAGRRRSSRPKGFARQMSGFDPVQVSPSDTDT